MNPKYLGDSYDIVKRFFCSVFQELGYEITVDPMFTGNWADEGKSFYNFLGTNNQKNILAKSNMKALFIDPDTGVNHRGGKQHVSFQRLIDESQKYQIVFSFDQSFSRQEDSNKIMNDKLNEVLRLGGHGMYYDSHARFIFVSATKDELLKLRNHLLNIGLPNNRLVECSY